MPGRAALDAGGGSIVTVGSINSLIAWPNDAAYTATKGAVLQFTRALSLETAERGSAPTASARASSTPRSHARS